jgi:tetratricopeptide (TPR) repeat protein
MTRNYTDKVNAQGWTANDGAYPSEERADGWYPSWKVRLFPRLPGIRFNGDVHEMVETSLRDSGFEIRKAPFVVHHYGECDADSVQDFDKQLHYFELGLQKLAGNPENPVALIELALQAGELGRFEQAIGLWNRLLILYPDNVEALFNKGYCLMGLKRYPEALVVSRRALDLVPSHKEAAFNYGTCELYVGNPEKSLARIIPLSDSNPDYPLLQALVAVLCFACGLPDEGRERAALLRARDYGIDSYIRERVSCLDAQGRHDLASRIASYINHAT